ncbi:hypothetical protein ACQ4LE_005060 [Meloidogyne hapla]
MYSKYFFILVLSIIILNVITKNFDCQSCANKVKCCWYGSQCKNGKPCCEKSNKPKLQKGICTSCKGLWCSVYEDPAQEGKTQCKKGNDC